MKDTFKRPSQATKPAAQPGVEVVRDLPEEKIETGKFIKHNEAQEIAKVNTFKAKITVEPGNAFLANEVKVKGTREIPLNIVKMLSLRFNVHQVKSTLKQNIEKFTVSLMQNTPDMDPNMMAKIKSQSMIVKDVVIAKNKDKSLLLVLNKDSVIKTVEDGQKLPIESLMQVDPKFSINYDAIPEMIKVLVSGEVVVKHYGEELVLELDYDKVIANVLIPSLIVDNKPLPVNAIKIPRTVLTGPFINTGIIIDGAIDVDSKIFINDSFICGRLQMTHDVFNAMAISRLSLLNQATKLVYVRTADVAAQSYGADALRAQMGGGLGGVNVQTIPLIQIPRETYTKSFRSSGNPLLDALCNNSAKVDTVDAEAILNVFGQILDGKVYPFNVGVSNNTKLSILPNYRKLALLALFGMTELDNKKDLPKIDVADDGRSVAIHLSI